MKIEMAVFGELLDFFAEAIIEEQDVLVAEMFTRCGVTLVRVVNVTVGTGEAVRSFEYDFDVNSKLYPKLSLITSAFNRRD